MPRRRDSITPCCIASKLALQVQSLFSYWSASSLPMRKDGVFRAVPNSALQVPADYTSLFHNPLAHACTRWNVFVL